MCGDTTFQAKDFRQRSNPPELQCVHSGELEAEFLSFMSVRDISCM